MLDKQSLDQIIDAHNKKLLKTILDGEDCTIEDLKLDGYIDAEYFDEVDEESLIRGKVRCVTEIRELLPEDKIIFWDSEVISEHKFSGDLLSMARIATRDALRDYMQDRFTNILLDNQ